MIFNTCGPDKASFINNAEKKRMNMMKIKYDQ